MIKIIKKRTNEEYVNELKIKNPSVIAIDKYINATTKIKHKCLTHDVIWEVAPASVLKGAGCSICHSERIANSKLRTHDEYVELLKIYAPHISVLEEYKEAKAKILHYCSIHDIKWKASPDNILAGHYCKMCGNSKIAETFTKTKDQYTEQLKNKNIVCIGKYVNSTTKVRHKCLIDGYEWDIQPSQILNGRGCPKCSNHVCKNQEYFVNEVKSINPHVEVIGEYINAKTKIEFRCKKCNYKWYTTPDVILIGCGCPLCKESHGERQITDWLEKNNISFEYQKKFNDCKYIRVLPFDFYLPDYNTIIEYDGEQHYRPINYFGGLEEFNKTVIRDKIKTDYCNNKGYTLLRITYKDDINTILNNYIIT